MAIKPSECGQLSAEDKAEIDAFEKGLDARLGRDYSAGKTLQISKLGSNERQELELIRRYEMAGWRIFRHDARDQRDDTYWEFKGSK